MMRRTRWWLAAAACGSLLVGVVGASAAPSESELSESIAEVTDLNAFELRLEESITPLERERREGGTTTVTLDANVLFEFGSARIPAQARSRVEAIARRIDPGSKVTVVGHTDSIGSEAANLRLSRARAQAVGASLRAGNPRLRLDVRGRGEAEPVEPNEQGGEDNPSGRAANRRVEIAWAS